MSLRVVVPARFGRLGRDGNILSLEAPWYPLVLGPGGAWDARVPHHVEVLAADNADVLLGDELALEAEHVGAYVPALIAPELYVVERQVAAFTLRVVSAHPLYTPPGPHAPSIEGLIDLLRVDEVSYIADAYRNALDTLGGAGLGSLRRNLTVAFVPSRVELASTADSTVIASDKLFEVFPAESALSFHERALMRGMFRSLVRPISAQSDPIADRVWADDMRSALLIDVDDARRHGHVRTPDELIGFAAFHPAVDQILYAPQIQFADAFFATVDESDAFRDDPLRAYAPIARGRRILESARDVLSAESFRAFAEELLHGTGGVRGSLAHADAQMAPRLSSWLAAPGLPVNYRLVSAESVPDGAGGFDHHIVIARDGSTRPEPVQVRVQDDNGNLLIGAWNEEGSQGAVDLHSDSPLHDVIVDPNLRLPESGDLTDGHPRADNATLHPWRPPLFSSFNLSYAASESRLDGLIDVVMHRRYDLERSFVFQILSDAVGTGGMARYIWGVGRKRDNNNRIGAISVAADLTRLRAGYVEGSLSGWQASVYLLGNIDTRVYATDPREGYSLRTSLRFGGVQRGDTSGLQFSASANVRGSLTIPIGLLNALHLFAGASFTLGEALPGQFQGMGGRYLLRGFESGELVGRGRVYAVAEHRWTAIRDLDWNFFHIAWVREVQLAAFGGVGAIFGELATGDTKLAADAGGGVRVHFQYGGVQPGVLSIDIATALTRQTNDVVFNNVVVRQRTPMTFYIAFDQYF
ncbi:MAG: hypothetical protein IPK60_20195 [Sandaracinaceae bacterium]|nr:hypothetical protein [Sandaracinaceae bacterium]